MNIIRVGLSVILLSVTVFGFYALFPMFTTTTVDDPMVLLAMGATLSDVGTNSEGLQLDQQMRKSGLIRGEGAYSAEGIAMIVKLQDGTHALSLENFMITNAPMLNVYAVTTQGTESVWQNIGPLKASTGNQNYRIADDITVENIEEILIYSKLFRRVFATASF